MEGLFNWLGSWLLPTGIVVIMFSMGLQITIAQIVAAADRHWLMVRALLANIVLLPLLALAVSRISGMPEAIAIGFIVASAAPGASLSPKLAEISHASIPFSLGLMFVMALLSTVTAPIMTRLLLPTVTDVQFEPGQIVGILVFFQMLPLLIGLAVHHWWPVRAGRLRRPSILLANVLFCAVVAFYLIRDFAALRTLPLPSLAAMFFMTIASIIIGWLLGGPDRATRQSLALGTSVEFTGLALLIITATFPDSPAAIAVVAFALIMIVTNTALALYWNRQPTFQPLEDTITSHL